VLPALCAAGVPAAADDAATYERASAAEAIAACSRAIQRTPKAAWACSNRGLPYIDPEQYDRAAPDLDQALRLDPKLAPVRGNRGLAWLNRRTTTGAGPCRIRESRDATRPRLRRGRSLAK
jgi:tetratricopeptide (TPR) repeat protein